MRYLASRGLFLLLTLLGLLSLFHDSWRPVFLLALCLLVVAHVCYSLLVNDSLLSPQAPAAFLQFLADLASCLYITSKFVVTQFVVLFHSLQSLCRNWIYLKMRRFWNRSYQLSSEANEHTTELTDKDVLNNENQTMSKSYDYGDSLGLTSTPLVTTNNTKNGGLNYKPGKSSSVFSDNSNSLIREESRLFNTDNSPWSANSSPRMRPKASGIKTVQTVAGPLLASTRYNIDPKLYFDVTSPGLTTRLTKYATEANNKLTHQSRYGPGQFPKVNLHASPTPLIKPNTKKATPVTVRVAQPITKKSHSCKKAIKLAYMNEKSPPSSYPTQTFKDLQSLKRHAAMDEVADLIKKQRTELSYQDELGNLEEMTQKRARDDSPKSDEETSTEYKSLRPKKRTKTPSCNDIINSLSSSIHVFSGIKRKAEDTSREFEKHFKSQDRSQTTSIKDAQDTSEASTSSMSEIIVPNKSPVITEEKVDNVNKPKSPEVKLSDKLFMGAQPENNEKLRALIEEQGSIKPKFSMEDKEEIRKEDITIMRQTSMKARLQSMFDAISGKTTNKINPDVVIHAEEIGNPSTSATLSSVTLTTNVNTSPITTSVIAPILKSTSPVEKVLTPKHVTFNLGIGSDNTKSTQPAFKIPEVIKSVETQEKSMPNLIIPSTCSTNVTAAPMKFSFGTISTTMTTSVAPIVSSSGILSLSNMSSTTDTSTTMVTASAPSMFKFDATTTSTQVATSTLTPSVISTVVSSAPSFNTNTTPSFNFGKTQVSNVDNKLTFGTNAITTSDTTKPTFSFGQNTTTTSSMVNFNPNVTTTSTTLSFEQKPLSTSVPASFGQQPTTTSNTISFGKNETTVTTSAPFTFNQITSSSALKFGAPTTTNASTYSFGKINPTSTPTLNFDQTKATTSAPTLSFNQSNVMTTAPVLNFGQTNITTNAPTFNFGQTSGTTNALPLSFVQTNVTTSAPTLNFGQTSVTTSTPTLTFGQTNVTTSAPTLNFGQTNVTTSASIVSFSQTNVTTSVPTINFGQTNATTSAPTLNFGQTATTSSATSLGFGSMTSISSNPTMSFRQNTTTSGVTANVFSGTNQNTNPNDATKSFPASTTTSSNVFPQSSTFLFGGGNRNEGFGQGNTFNTAKTTSASSFTITPSFSTKNNSVATTNIFSTTNTTTPVTTSPNIFGSTVTSPSTTTSASLFSGDNFKSPFGSVTNATPSFGTPTTTSATSTFGSNLASFGSPAAQSFGSNLTAVTTAPSFGSNTSQTASSSFGSTNASTFGAQAPAFGSITTPNINFGATSNGFGNSSAQSPFAGTSTQNASFSNANAISPSTTFPNGNFAFSNNTQPPVQAAAQPSFNFASNNSSTTGGVFQFGAGVSKPGGFNFNASTNTPNINFGATSTFGNTPQQSTASFPLPAPSQGGNMFSIGTGSTAPRARTVRDRLRKQR